MDLLDLFFPPSCVSCGKTGRYFCNSCRKKIRFASQICPECGKPAIYGKTHVICRKMSGLDGLICVFSYEGAVKRAIIKLKYKFITDLAEEFAGLALKAARLDERNILSLMHFTPGVSFGSPGVFVLVPVPLYRRRLNWRGFNQSELLGKMIADSFGWQFRPDILIRNRQTEPQVGLRGNSRISNVQNAFSVALNPSFIIRNSLFLLLDDVWTTGSTMKECCRVLKRSGAKEVWGMTIAK